ncbi:MAG: hypothetical protein O7F09_07785 [Chloroflexi bacterium]|nr:hypothetical protein [Chloroflexota bacterium]MCZ6892398.1 hypothetical protein [Chloroflexota bacterium]
MAWIQMIEEEEARGFLKEAYGRMRRDAKFGVIDEIAKVVSLRPDIMRVNLRMTMTFGGSGLGRYREELISTGISQILGCKF